MKKTVVYIVLALQFLVSGLSLYGQVSAVVVSPNCGAGSQSGTPVICPQITQQTSSNPVINIIKDVIDILSFVVGISAVIGLVVGGLKLVVAGGDAQAVSSARSGIIYALVGIVVVILAQTIVVFVLDNLK